MKVNKKQNAGFTLIELMVVIAIIGIFSAVAIPSYLSSKAKSRDSIRLGDLKNISLAIQNSWQESGYKTWPQNLSEISSYFSNNTVPKDPQGNDYLYTPYGDDTGTGKKDFCLATKLETPSMSTTTCNMKDAYTFGKTFPIGYNYTYVGP
ncbi:MAG: prepilin-type N-terminal cleavage/methylation domain-containing protein [Candidatus Paceibacterota bacterium]